MRDVYFAILPSCVSIPRLLIDNDFRPRKYNCIGWVDFTFCGRRKLVTITFVDMSMAEIVSSVPSLTFRFGDKRSDVIQAKTLFFVYLITLIALDIFQSFTEKIQFVALLCCCLVAEYSDSLEKGCSLDFVNQSSIFYYRTNYSSSDLFLAFHATIFSSIASASVTSGRSSPAGSSGASATSTISTFPLTTYMANRLQRFKSPIDFGPTAVNSISSFSVNTPVGSPNR
mmetsp:Transcript_60588/g.148647  ORF Transcript_60588/g.148647 Transcript_60588/m.148647 type:complete len:228 (-) Transcript_60588:393-1076(-)